YEWKHVEFVVRLALLKAIGQLALIAKSIVVDHRNAADPVSISHITHALHIILSSCEIPHEVSPIHQSHLVSKEPVEVVGVGRCFISSCLWVLWNVEPGSIEVGVVLFVARIPYSREELLIAAGISV